MNFSTTAQRRLQDLNGSRRLADRVESMIVADEVDEGDEAFIGSRDFFLASVDASGMPTVSYEGGDPGLVHVAGPRTLFFPHCDGNGMLFIDMERPNRVRVQAVATVSDHDPEVERWPGATHPSWKRIDALQDVMPEQARQRTAQAGGSITPQEYDAKVADGTS